MTDLFGPAQCLNRLSILNRTRLLDVKRLLIIGKLVFQLIHFQLGGFRPRFVVFSAIGGFRHHFILFFETDL